MNDFTSQDLSYRFTNEYSYFVSDCRVQVGHLPFHDIIVLTSENSLLLYVSFSFMKV